MSNYDAQNGCIDKLQLKKEWNFKLTVYKNYCLCPHQLNYIQLDHE